MSLVYIDHKKCCPWCKECVPRCMIEGWTSGNNDVDKFIKYTNYNAKNNKCLEWIPYDRFEGVEQIAKGGFSKVYSATWIDGKANYFKQDDGSWKRRETGSIRVALKKLNESQNISAEYLNELKIHWRFYITATSPLRLYGITKDPQTKELIMVTQLIDQGNLRRILLNNFNNMFWRDKLLLLTKIVIDLKNLHDIGYSHKDLHSGNILRGRSATFIADFGLSGPSNEQKSNDKIYGVLPYIAPEVLNRKPYTLSSDIYSIGVIMTELSSGKSPFYERKHDLSLALEICSGIRPKFGKGTPEIYKKLANRCMDVNPDQRPKTGELFEILMFWYNACDNNEYNQEKEKFGYKEKEIKVVFDEADKEIPNISTLYEINPDAIYTSRVFTNSNLPNPINSSYLDENSIGNVFKLLLL
ncbi:Cmk1p [Rhizophagus irregularis DAOM 197198w]|uniref:Cmk1p n=1 Tax=Rhizophagus irregularis (strain DAOM 197198w) TaxID=1432141 RepID=A0A015K0H7_RHIIW|nr:Cmk1p [Rhizophagus irregularis DAOM 197198w]